VGGDFTVAGGVTARHIARWDGMSWFDVGGGMSAGLWPGVTSLAVHENQLVAGGWFERAGGVDASHIAVWDGVQWSALGSGVDNFVWAVGNYAGLIIAAGDFLTAGSGAAAHIAAWDGQAWQPLGAGVQDFARAVYARGPRLYVGGQFLQAGGQPSFYIARWDNTGSAVEENGAEGLAGGLRLDLRSGRTGPGAGDIELTFTLAHPAHTELAVHDLTGRRVAALYAGWSDAGEHDVTWDGRDAGGHPCARGVYFVRLRAGGEQAVRRIVLAGSPR
jgi:hypothetical protein